MGTTKILFILTLALPMKLVAQQSNYRFLSDTKLIVTALEHKGVFTELFSKNKEGEFADIAFQDSLGTVPYNFSSL